MKNDVQNVGLDSQKPLTRRPREGIIRSVHKSQAAGPDAREKRDDSHGEGESLKLQYAIFAWIEWQPPLPMHHDPSSLRTHLSVYCRISDYTIILLE
jgi:hypothetical protein